LKFRLDSGYLGKQNLPARFGPAGKNVDIQAITPDVSRLSRNSLAAERQKEPEPVFALTRTE
jgi:hypothetical protein